MEIQDCGISEEKFIKLFGYEPIYNFYEIELFLQRSEILTPPQLKKIKTEILGLKNMKSLFKFSEHELSFGNL